MTVDEFGRSPKTGQNVANVAGVSLEYMNSNFLREKVKPLTCLVKAL